ncbi:hypothetical protein PtB15_17B232 [Puccinia triticina]|nr:hypothetical protein PtB15_17B232 [Puccinia triticina]
MTLINSGPSSTQTTSPWIDLNGTIIGYSTWDTLSATLPSVDSDCHSNCQLSCELCGT